MNTGQSMLTILAMVLLTVTIINVNRNNLTTSTVLDQNRIDILAISLATSIIEDATSLAFDEKTIAAAVASSSSLTAAASLGIDGTETAAKPNLFDDFDDYGCYVATPKKDTIAVPGSTASVIFWTLCQVDYVNPGNPNTVSASPTYHKRIKLRIFRPGMNDAAGKTDTIKMTSVYSYWYFR
ncbi:MAG: hypothetical protein WCJ01_11785 [Ignavibacteria bacterium]